MRDDDLFWYPDARGQNGLDAFLTTLARPLPTCPASFGPPPPPKPPTLATAAGMMSLRSVAQHALTTALTLFSALVTVAGLELNISAVTSGAIDSDWTTVYYSSRQTEPLLIGNDGGAATGGLHVFTLDSGLSEVTAVSPILSGRTKLVTTFYGVGGNGTAGTGRDLVVTIAQSDSVIRVFEAPGLAPVPTTNGSGNDNEVVMLGDWNAICPWRGPSGSSYFFLFGKGGRGIQYLVRPVAEGSKVQLVEVRSFTVPAVFVGCAVSESGAKLYLTEDVDQDFYVMDLAESTAQPVITKVSGVSDATGVAVYASSNSTSGGGDLIFVTKESSIAVYDSSLALLGAFDLTGLEDIEAQGLSIYQGSIDTSYPAGVVAFAIEADGFKGFGIASLGVSLAQLDITPNTAYDPRVQVNTIPGGSGPQICKQCSMNGYCTKPNSSCTSCSCFSGSTGRKCDQFTCQDNCSGHGTCSGPNQCTCDAGWGGLHCSFLLVEPSYETDAIGGDGDDPAIWISPASPELSRIITTTKSEDDAGLSVFDLYGKIVQHLSAGEPNNVDVIYGFVAGNKTVDLAFAACRADDTLCLFEITPNGTLTSIPGGIQPVIPNFTVYGSCVYRSPTTRKQYLFVNEKSARYLQYELTSSPNGTLQTALVRDFVGGSGGQVEGCVADDDNGWLFLGEEPSALWRYGAEPDSTAPGLRVAHVGDGTLNAEAEGVTLVVGSAHDRGFVILSNQGVSSYAVYRRAAPHEHVLTFTITASADGSVDAVSNTDGVAAVGRALGADFPRGLVVVHDDANQLPGGGTSAQASFKLVSLEKVLGAEQVRALGLLDDVDAGWDPRAVV